MVVIDVIWFWAVEHGHHGDDGGHNREAEAREVEDVVRLDQLFPALASTDDDSVPHH